MIAVHELRVGNWVLYKGCFAQVSIITRASICVDGTIIQDENISAERKDIGGIPLTPEILEKAGFEHNDFFYMGMDDERKYRGYLCDGNSTIVLSEIQYLHQLQNLYFALTGQELTVNL